MYIDVADHEVAGDDSPDHHISLTCVADLADHCSPSAPGAIVKCVLVVLGVVSLPDSCIPPRSRASMDMGMPGGDASCDLGDFDDATPELEHQLRHACTDLPGLEVETWSCLPQGSGLGASSILAACVIAAVASALGRSVSREVVVHLVLRVEQMMCTGGGSGALVLS